jgi:hypothetical protein
MRSHSMVKQGLLTLATFRNEVKLQRCLNTARQISLILIHLLLQNHPLPVCIVRRWFVAALTESAKHAN